MYGELKRGGGSINFKKLNGFFNCFPVCVEVNKISSKSAVNQLIEGLLTNIIEQKSVHCEQIIAQCFKPANSMQYAFLDKIFLNGAWAFIFTFFSFAIFFYCAFGKYGIAGLISHLVEQLFICAVNQPIARLFTVFGVSNFICAFILEGLLSGVLSVLVFLPRLAVCYLFIFIAEQSGVLARLAFLLNFAFSRFNTTGRTFFSLISCYGCTVSGILQTNTCANKEEKLGVCLSLPFIPCSAKLPVILYLCNFANQVFGFWSVFFAIVGGFLCSLVVLWAYGKIIKNKKSFYVISFPPYRVVSAKSILKALQKFVKEFIIRLVAIVALVNCFLFLLTSLSTDFKFLNGEQIEFSILAVVCKRLAIIFKPAGLNDWRLVLSLIVGLFAKESVISAFTLLGIKTINKSTLISFLLFFAIYPPCINALATYKAECGKKFTIIIFLLYFTLAYLAAAIANYLGLLFAVALILSACFVALAVQSFKFSVHSKKSKKIEGF